MTQPLPLILLPGIGTDARVFAVQKMAFPQLVVPPWLPPRWQESLSEYAARMAEAVNPGGPCYIGGMSFGGMVALEMSRHLPVKACLLISSLRSARELPQWARWLGPGAWLLPPWTDWVVSATGTVMLRTLGPVLPKPLKQSCSHLSRMYPCPMLPWACRAVVKWKPDPNSWTCPISHLHGDRDRVIPHRRTTPTQIVPDGGHVLPLTHPFVVNDFIRGVIDRTHA